VCSAGWSEGGVVGNRRLLADGGGLFEAELTAPSLLQAVGSDDPLSSQ
jgi:hypothetical protein